jgi:hypothetical protein
VRSGYPHLRYRQKQEQNSVQVHEIPFRETRQELIAAVNGGLKETVGDDMANATVDLIRPYRHGGDDTLCALHDIDIDDKHMLIIPIVRATKVIVEHVTIGGIVMKNCTLNLEASGQINVMAFGRVQGTPKFEGDVRPTFDIFFQDGQPFGGKPVIPTLHKLAELISATIKIVESIPIG